MLSNIPSKRARSNSLSDASVVPSQERVLKRARLSTNYCVTPSLDEAAFSEEGSEPGRRAAKLSGISYFDRATPQKLAVRHRFTAIGRTGSTARLKVISTKGCIRLLWKICPACSSPLIGEEVPHGGPS